MFAKKPGESFKFQSYCKRHDSEKSPDAKGVLSVFRICFGTRAKGNVDEWRTLLKVSDHGKVLHSFTGILTMCR
jgi:hypothetical protein